MIHALLALAVQSVQLYPPEKSKPEDVKKAAEVMVARCKTFGYSDVSAKVVKAKLGQAIELSSKEGITPAMQQRIRSGLALFPILQHEIVLTYPLTDAESDRFLLPTGDLAKAKAPAGTKWVEAEFWGTGSGKALLLVVDGGRFQKGDFTLATVDPIEDGGNQWLITLTESGRKKWASLPERSRGGFITAIYNGRWMFEHYSVSRFSEEGGVVTALPSVTQLEAIAVTHPLPFALK